MICPDCKKDLNPTEFIGCQKSCYHCVYKKKIEFLKKVKAPETTLCRVCNKKIIFDKTLKKRQRNVFCSSECADIGNRDKRNSHWTRKLRELIPCKF